MAARGFLAMDISIHDLENGQPDNYYADMFAGPLKEYFRRGREDRMTFYYRRVILGIVRAVDYLTTRPEWDMKHMIITGGSQGGALALIGAGVDPRITALAANVPGMCDHSGRNFGRPSGWPQLVPIGDNKKLDPRILAVSAYYDAANFARKFKGSSIMGIGLIDTSCPPTTCFAAYNVLPNPKQVDISPLMGHSSSKSYTELRARWILEQSGINR
jgi:cephalosporin-C deacetylase-like acetyl esterase